MIHAEYPHPFINLVPIKLNQIEYSQENLII